MTPPMPPEVRAAFDACPSPARPGLERLRALIFRVASGTPGVGRLEEGLRWGQPAYLTPETKSGSTIRLGMAKSGDVALFVHCQTRLIEEFRTVAPPGTRFEGTRAVLFADDSEIDEPALALLIRRALTWHLEA